MCCLQLPPFSAVSELALFLHAICDVPLLPHPVEAAVDPAAHSSIHYALNASTSHHVVELHSEQPVCLYAVVAVLVEQEQEDDERTIEAVQVERIEQVLNAVEGE